MNRYIDADEIEKYPIRFNNYDKKNGSLDFVSGVESVIEFVKNIPTADIRENIRGEWIFKETMIRSPLAENYYCSICKISTTRCWNFCPNCGADTREVKE